MACVESVFMRGDDAAGLAATLGYSLHGFREPALYGRSPLLASVALKMLF